VRDEGTEVLFSSPEHREVADFLLATEAADGSLPEPLLDGLSGIEAQALLSGLMLAEGQEAWAADPERIFSDCRRAVTAAVQHRRLRELPELVREAERAGDLQAVEKYLRELVDIKKNL
jgi:hypothetical protein